MLKLDGKKVAEQVQLRVGAGAKEFQKKYGRSPKLAVVLVGSDPASVIYTTKKGDAAVAAGLSHESIHFPATATPEEVCNAIQKLNNDDLVDGILIQRPLPKAFNENEVVYWISPEKDVDAFHPENTGRLQLGLSCLKPCTPTGVIEILSYYNIDVAGKIACVIGRSSIVGKPMAALLLQKNATVIQCHSHTHDLAHFTKQADILVIAAGKPQMIKSQHIKPGAVVIDVGIHRTISGKVVGDADYNSIAAVASAATPVPGGVGPMTIALLLKNTLDAAHARMSCK